MWFPAPPHHSTQLAALLHPFSSTNERQLNQTQTDKPTECKQDQTKRETVKFSIENILKDKTSPSPDEDVQDVSEVPPDNKSTKEVIAGRQFSWLQCTRYKPPKLPRLKKKDGVKKRKLGRNPRVPFTQHQVAVLEHKFRRTHYLSSMDVAELSSVLSLTENRVKIWFQNRRARERRDREASQRNQIIQAPASETMAASEWSYPVSHSNMLQCGESLANNFSAFSPVPTSN
ncbi:homeobox protein MSX-2-like [Saccostrea cucullata]|uniref:homeobox protein MSX-2-like n=1 Tax=Saccostrea cuccullata TaxID=36930 RepID=UPI002ED05993